jgi:23S rRNA pseudouridine2605 synthase
VELQRDRIEVDAQVVREARKVYLMLNKPRGLVTTASDEHGRATVFECFVGASLPPLSPAGRLDKASEGLLLFTNDTTWAARITDPVSELEKTYHVQVNYCRRAPTRTPANGHPRRGRVAIRPTRKFAASRYAQ